MLLTTSATPPALERRAGAIPAPTSVGSRVRAHFFGRDVDVGGCRGHTPLQRPEGADDAPILILFTSWFAAASAAPHRNPGAGASGAAVASPQPIATLDPAIPTAFRITVPGGALGCPADHGARGQYGGARTRLGRDTGSLLDPKVLWDKTVGRLPR